MVAEALSDLQKTGRLTALSWEEISTGPNHDPSWKCSCKIDGVILGEGTGKSKQAAKDVASRTALSALIKRDGSESTAI